MTLASDSDFNLFYLVPSILIFVIWLKYRQNKCDILVTRITSADLVRIYNDSG